MSTNKKAILFFGIIPSVLALLALYIYFQVRPLPKNPEDTVGNTAGNLYNSGLFCERDGVVYFSNTYDGGALYCMNTDESRIRKISTSIPANIIADPNYIYYFQMGTAGGGAFENVMSTHNYMRCERNGSKSKILSKDVIVYNQIVGNNLYLLSNVNKTISFFKINLSNNERTDLANYVINPSCVYNGKIYYSGTIDDLSLYQLDPTDDVTSTILNINSCYPIIEGDYLYYMDVDRNYALSRYSFSKQQKEILTRDRVDCYNIGNGYIYYQKNSTTPQLKMMRTDGTDEAVIAEGNYTKINMTSQYVYFREFGIDGTTYHCPIGSTSYSIFNATEK